MDVQPWIQVRLRTLLLAVAVAAAFCWLIRIAWGGNDSADLALGVLAGLASFLAANGLVCLVFGLFGLLNRLVAPVRRPATGPPDAQSALMASPTRPEPPTDG